jgi:hypothetical protein
MLAACATAPDPAERFIDDRNALISTVPDAPAEWAARGVAGKAPTGDWMTQFNDPVMNALVAEALAANPSLEARAALTRSSRALARAARDAGADVVIVAGPTSLVTPRGVKRIEQATGSAGGFTIQNGVSLSNGSVTVELSLFDDDPQAGDVYTFHYMPYFNSALSFQDGTISYLF